MPQKPADPTVAPQVELAVRRLDLISMLPCTASRILPQLFQFESAPSQLAETIESDPALAARILSLLAQQRLSPSIQQAIDNFSLRQIREAFFSVKIYQNFDDENRTQLRKQLIQHSLAVGCCAEDIAEIVSAPIEPNLAYLAGLLHNIGLLALDEIMPRSFTAIIEDAKSKKACICGIEQKHLGTDHTILGKRLAQKWQLPKEIALAIWLHHSDVGTICEGMPGAKIAQIVRLADSVVRQCDIGLSGSFDTPEPAEQIAQALSIGAGQLEQIRTGLADKTAQKSKVIGLDLPRPQTTYCNVLHTTAARLAKDNNKLALQNSQLQTTSGYLDFTTHFLASVNSNTAPVDVAESFALQWQRFYQTGLVCLFLAPRLSLQTLEAAVVENAGKSKTVILKAPADMPAIPEELTKGFAIVDAQGHIDWLFEQLEVDFNMGQTKILPLLCGHTAAGVIVFEFRYPAETKELEEKFKMAACVGGAVLEMALASVDRQSYAEQFAQLLGSRPRDVQPDVAVEPDRQDAQPEVAAANSLAGLVEMAAGAAHELNNPLSVISGRAQILAESETDAEKKQMLEQIQRNSRQLAGLIDDLMSFAEPQQPRPSLTDTQQMLDEAIQLTSTKMDAEHINAQIKISEPVENVFVDSAQVVSAIANIISNSLESYADNTGPVKITADADESGNVVKLEISDLGCGMDAETLQKATQPFFSAKPAGRKRGMGLAHAQRIIELNNGRLKITSQAGSGTTVTVSLPCK